MNKLSALWDKLIIQNKLSKDSIKRILTGMIGDRPGIDGSRGMGKIRRLILGGPLPIKNPLQGSPIKKILGESAGETSNIYPNIAGNIDRIANQYGKDSLQKVERMPSGGFKNLVQHNGEEVIEGLGDPVMLGSRDKKSPEYFNPGWMDFFKFRGEIRKYDDLTQTKKKIIEKILGKEDVYKSIPRALRSFDRISGKESRAQRRNFISEAQRSLALLRKERKALIASGINNSNKESLAEVESLIALLRGARERRKAFPFKEKRFISWGGPQKRPSTSKMFGVKDDIREILGTVKGDTILKYTPTFSSVYAPVGTGSILPRHEFGHGFFDTGTAQYRRQVLRDVHSVILRNPGIRNILLSKDKRDLRALLHEMSAQVIAGRGESRSARRFLDRYNEMNRGLMPGIDSTTAQGKFDSAVLGHLTANYALENAFRLKRPKVFLP